MCFRMRAIAIAPVFYFHWIFARTFAFRVVVPRHRYCRSIRPPRTACAMASPFLEALSQAASDALGKAVQLDPTTGGGASGGGGASTTAVVDSATGTRYFVKSATTDALNMLKAEYLGVKAMAESQTIRVPTPIAYGECQSPGRAFVIFEYLDFTSGGSQYELGQKLAQMHRCTAPNGKFGFSIDNTIGATPQPNLPWKDDWADFWDEHRLGRMLRLTEMAGGLSQERARALGAKTRELLSHKPVPSLLHGDLWGGNKGFCKENGKIMPCVFDPATYYGDREADVALTYLFGGFTGDFYEGYNDTWELPDGHEQRRTIYNLYHILNHDVLFGGGYIRQARGMIESIMKY